MDDITKAIFGEKLVNFHNELKTEFDKIENKYIEFFKSRPPINEFHKHDELTNHYFLYYDSYRILISFTTGNDLPDYIKKECIEVFNKIIDKYSKQ